MGLPKPALRFIAREHRRKPFVGSVLMLGHQSVWATLEEARVLVAGEGIAPAEFPAGADVRTNIPGWLNTPHEHNISDVAFFRLLGLAEVQALDCSNFEGAEIVHDLNLPVPAGLHDRFDLIVDGGTLEHVFDIRQSLTNVARMLRGGGRIIHFSPASNWVNHGFYQFSPTLFYDYYVANGFAELRGFLVEHNIYLLESAPWDFYEVGLEGKVASRHGLLTVFVAEKTLHSTVDKVPLQSHYTQLYGSAGRGSVDRQIGPLRGLIRRLKAIRPDSLKRLVRRIDRGYERRMGVGKLKRWGRLS
jgi:SAM-dependent methyltransferase